jgi:putative acetyltransferase
MIILPARTPAQFELANDLFRQYAAELNVDLCFQGFAAELENLPAIYGEPHGELLLAADDNDAIGCVGLRRFSATDAEMKRLFVRPGHRDSGVGRVLAQRIIERARDLGYRRMLLDTLDSMDAAKGLYWSLGFAPCAAYYDNPLPNALYFSKNLVSP